MNSFILIVVDCPKGVEDVDNLQRLAQALLPLPDGVQRLADTVWLVEIEKGPALDFLLKFPQIAEVAGQKFRALNIPPKPPVEF